ncbi:M23 family metallopeptidase [Aureimonas glaciei]|uniref:Membrane protein n=1 Tax=Aureimonas glaciei TaxID=1776957 RepID=A0A917DC29_9HYPH|nr:M23 family metallopeptidase [Aureimonas glaciei]GGD25446.1 membrane protein [Aureimonas glaciei]
MTSVQKDGFGRRRVPHTVIIARGDDVRHFTVRPWVFAVSTAIASTLALSCVATGGYLLLRDDLIASGTASEYRLERAYEDRIAALRSQLDRAVSRQILDRQSVESKVDTLIGQQEELKARYAKLQPLLDRARSTGLLSASIPVPQPKPADDAPVSALAPGSGESAPIETIPDAPSPLAYAPAAASPALARFGLVDHSTTGSVLRSGSATQPASVTASSPIPVALIQKIGASIERVEDGQIADLTSLVESARSKTEHIAGVLRSEGILVAVAPAAAPTSAEGGEGGPLVEIAETERFDVSLAELDQALTDLQVLQRRTDRIPLARPVDTLAVSSTFGVRPDPFLGRSAMHTGIDFVAPTGTDVDATASGTVVQAGVNSGYGNLVEVDHGGGLVTRYGHLSQILVNVGDKVKAGAIIGRVGTTGRSTGPHLHYEVRRDGSPIDPSRFLRAGRRISSFG